MIAADDLHERMASLEPVGLGPRGTAWLAARFNAPTLGGHALTGASATAVLALMDVLP